MNKQEFLARLRDGLSGLPQSDIDERVSFYGEMIDDQTEEGLSEEEAIAAAGSVAEIVKQIRAEALPAKISTVKAASKRRLNAGEIALLILGSPIWLSLAIAVFAVLLSLYISLWAVIVSLWAVFGSLAVCVVCGALDFVIFIASGSAANGIAMLAAGFVCAGFSIFAFFGCKSVTKGMLLLTKKAAKRIGRCFNKKEAAQ